jgi:hypothetical protein
VEQNDTQVTSSIDAQGLPHKSLETLMYDIDLAAIRELLIGHKTVNDGVRALVEIERHVAKLADSPRWAAGEP